LREGERDLAVSDQKKPKHLGRRGKRTVGAKGSGKLKAGITLIQKNKKKPIVRSYVGEEHSNWRHEHSSKGRPLKG